MLPQRLLLFIFLCLIIIPVFAQENTVRLGIIVDNRNEDTQRFIDGIYEETRKLIRSKYDLVIDEDDILVSGFDAASIISMRDQLLNDPEIDIVIGVDALTSHVLAQGGPYNKPVIAAVVIDPQVQELPLTKKGRSGVKNLAYLDLPYSPLRDIEVFYKMIGFDKLALLLNEEVYNGIPGVREYSEKGLEELGVEYEFVFVEEDMQATLNKLDDSFDGVLFYPNSRLSDDNYQALIDGVNARGLKSFSVLGRTHVDRGVLGGIAPMSNFPQITRRVALNIQRILNDEDPEDFNVEINQAEELVINMATARQIGYSPNWETLSEAILINEERDDIERKINIYDAIREGLEQNLLIDIAEDQVEIAQKDANVAKSRLMPTVDGSFTHTIVDETTATNSFGTNPENRGLLSLQLSQVIYSEAVAANKQIQDILVDESKAAMEVQVLDVILEVSVTYLNLMSAKTIEGIQKQNLEVTRKNLELARVSVALGQAHPSDLYRWQGEIAVAKSNLLNAQAARKNAELALNQILNREINEEFLTEEIDLNDSRLMVNNQVIDDYVNSPSQFYRFADFMVKTAIERAPDLAQVSYNVQAQQRSIRLNERNQYIPNFSVGGGYNYELYRSGAGEPPEGFTINDYNWNIQFGASLPIFQSGERRYKVQQSRIQLEQINTQKKNLERLIEQQVRTELENIKASYTNIDLTKDAEEAQVKNFLLIQDSYSQGQVSVTQLLDAQTSAVSARLNSANAVYIMLIDLMNMERASGNFYMVMNDEQKADFVNELISFFNED